MTEDPRSTRSNAAGGPMSERMQELLSRAAEDQLTEQRQVSAVLADLRGLVGNLGEQLRGTASSARLESLGGDVSSLFTELRMSTSALGERLDVLARRVDEQAASTAERVTAQGSGSEALAVRVSGLSEDLSAQSTALDRLTDSVEALGAFPAALAALQRDMSGVHDRLAPLGDVRTGLADLVARTGAIEALRPEVGTISSRMEGLATSDEVARSRDSLVAAVTERLDRLEHLADRPALTQEALDASLAPLLVKLDDAASGGQVVERLGGLDDRLAALEARVGQVAERLSDVSDAAGGVPAVATDLARMSGRLDEVAALRAEVLATREAVLAQQDDSPVPSLVLGVAALREDVEDLGSRVSELTVPTAEAVATAVGQQVTDRLVDELAPRVADVVLTRVAATLVEQVAGSVTASVQSGLTEKVRAANADSERRISAHVDEAVLALAEALLRRRRGTRSGTTALLGAGELEVAAPVHGESAAAAVEGGDAVQEPADAMAPAELPDDVPPQDVHPEQVSDQTHEEDAPDDEVLDGPGADDEEPDDEAPDDEVLVPEQELAAQDADPAAVVTRLRNIDVGGESAVSGSPGAGEVASPYDVEDAAQAQTPVEDDDDDGDGKDGQDGEDDGGPAMVADAQAAEREQDADDAVEEEFPAGPPLQAPAVATFTLPGGPEPVAAPTQSVVPAPQSDDDGDEQDGPPRRPWWRPGG